MSIASITASSRLAGIVGPAHVVSESPELSAYEIGGHKPSAVVRPGSAEEVAEIVKFAFSEKLALVPCGARTKLSMGLPPRQYDLALDLTRLDRIIAYDPGDLTLAVEPGMHLHALEKVLGEHKQWLPLAVPYFAQTTAGGAIASGVDTPLRQMYGTGRDYVLGLEFVTGEGVAAKSGGRVVKNVSGYDMHKLMIGALGTLGVITKINLRTFPVPVDTRVFVANFDSAARAMELRHRLARSPLRPMSLEILSPSAAAMLASDTASRLVTETHPADVLQLEQWALVAEFSGSEQVLARCERDFRQMAGESSAAQVTTVTGETVSPLSSRVREFIPIALSSSPATTILKMSVLPTRMTQMLAIAEQAAELNSLDAAAMARGLGVIYFALLPADRGEESRRRAIQATDHILNECAKLDGNATIPWSPAEWKSALKAWGLPRADFDQMRKLKAVFDPGAVLAPGRFVGGL
ncbi:MAG TPA: FAD-binding oxidoreductase [Candidatus Acidoferrales bacterium]|jgi:glycolate oxidase FAD binding subunit|nr:FAD-binding oxidoreductase [Candidatus Acidoferrales bacterium]